MKIKLKNNKEVAIFRNSRGNIQIGNLEFKDMNDYNFKLIEVEEHLDFLLNIFNEIKNKNDKELIKDDIKKLSQNNEKGVFVLVSNNTNDILCYNDYDENFIENNEFVIEIENIIEANKIKINILDECVLVEILKFLSASELREIQITKEWLEEELEFIKEKTGIDFFKKYSNDLLLNFFKETHQELMEDCIRDYKEEIEYLENTITELYGKGE